MPCHQGFDSQIELFEHYSWHIDQLNCTQECSICRMKITLEEHLKSHYQQMHPTDPIPSIQQLNITQTKSNTSRKLAPPPPPQPSATPALARSRQSKLQQTRSLSEGGKAKPTTAPQVAKSTIAPLVAKPTLTSNNTAQRPSDATCDDDDDSSHVVNLGRFFK